MTDPDSRLFSILYLECQISTLRTNVSSNGKSRDGPLPSHSSPLMLQARRKEIAAEEKRKTEALKESLTEKLGSAEQKAALLLQQRARDTEMARVHRAVEAKARQEAMLWNT